MPKSAWAALVSVDEGQRFNEQLQKFFQADFPDHPSAKVGRSYEDQQAEEIMNRTCKFIDGRYQVGLLLKKSDEETAATIPSAAAEATARQRTRKMAQRLGKTPHLKKLVEDSIEKLLEEGWAEILPNPAPPSDLVWYLPAVLSERKGKWRFCLDGAATSCGVSLNSMLLTGESSVVTIFSAIQNSRRFDFFVVYPT